MKKVVGGRVVLGLDPGGTTGWAVVDTTGKVLGTGNLQPEDLEESLDYILRLLNRNKTQVSVIVEEFPLSSGGHLADTLREVVTTISRVLGVYSILPTSVTPGVWKTSAVGLAPVAVPSWEGQPLTPHQRDAIKIARYFLTRVRK